MTIKLIVSLFHKHSKHKKVFYIDSPDYSSIIEDLTNYVSELVTNSGKVKLKNVCCHCSNYERANDTKHDIEIYCYIVSHHKDSDYIKYNVYNKSSNHLVYSKRYIYNYKNEGNCVDRFIALNIEPNITTLRTYIKDIKSRVNTRKGLDDYHSTLAYENDFSTIMNIRDCASKITELSNKMLEALADKYTKI